MTQLAEANNQKKKNPAAALETVQEALAISVADGNETNQAKCYLLLGEVNEKFPRGRWRKKIIWKLSTAEPRNG